MLRPETVDYTNLLLDPNNPRLAKQFGGGGRVNDSEILSKQTDLERIFGIPPKNDPQEETDRLIGDTLDSEGDDFYSIQDLKDSMRRIGFVGIQNIIVRQIEGTSTYVVLEGNRRVASIKAVIREHESALPNHRNRITDENKLRTLTRLKVMVFNTDGLTQEQIDRNVSTMLGLRHYGSQLSWEILPRAKNIYDEYIKISPEPFAYTTPNGRIVAEVIAKGASEVKKLLRGYLCYKQLCELYPVQPHHFSLILACVENTNLTSYGFI